jgi:hypothetical protein
MAFDIFEEECGATGPSGFAWPGSPFDSAQGRRGRLSPHVHFGDAIGDFGDLKNRVGFGLNALQLAGAIERGDPLAEVVEGQRIPLCERRL